MQVIHYTTKTALHEMSLIQSDYSLFFAFQLRRSGIEAIETLLFVRQEGENAISRQTREMVAKIWSRKF